MKIINRILIYSISILMVSCGIDNSKEYVISANDALTAYLNKDDIYASEKIANILLCEKSETYQLVDIRTPHEFAINHLSNAINIPFKDILDTEYYDMLNQDKKINVLYCNDGHQALEAYMMLKQLNFKNVKVALGGFDFIQNYIIDNYGIKTGIYDDEKPRYDFIRLIAGVDLPENESISKPSVISVNPNKVIKDFDEECPDLN